MGEQVRRTHGRDCLGVEDPTALVGEGFGFHKDFRPVEGEAKESD
jgi:hypothetical protein